MEQKNRVSLKSAPLLSASCRSAASCTILAESGGVGTREAGIYSIYSLGLFEMCSGLLARFQHFQLSLVTEFRESE